MHSAPEGNMAMRQPVHAECSQKGFCCEEKDDLCLSPFNMPLNYCLGISVVPLAQVRPASRSKPSGHSQSKEPRVFTQLDPTGQGSFWHSSTSECLKQL